MARGVFVFVRCVTIGQALEERRRTRRRRERDTRLLHHARGPPPLPLRVINAFGQRGKGETRASEQALSVLPARAPSRFSPFHLLGNLGRASTQSVSLEREKEREKKRGEEEGLVCVYDLIPGRSYVTLERSAPSRPFEATKERRKRASWTASLEGSEQARCVTRRQTEINGALIED